jgi:hypothetical protein
MTTRTLISAGSGLVVAAAIGLAWQNFRSARAIEATRSRVVAQRIRLDGEIEVAQERLMAARRTRQRLEATLAGLKKAPVVVPRANRFATDALLRANPRLQALYFNVLREQQRKNSAPLYHFLGLSPEQIEKMEDLNMEATERSEDLRWAAETERTSPADRDYRALEQQITDQLNTDTQALLGEAGYQQLQDLKRAAPVSYLVGQVGAAVAATVAPLSADQGARLTQILADASSSYQTGQEATLTTVNWDAALARAQGILSDPQLMALRTTIAEQQYSQVVSTLAQLLRRAQGR